MTLFLLYEPIARIFHGKFDFLRMALGRLLAGTASRTRSKTWFSHLDPTKCETKCWIGSLEQVQIPFKESRTFRARFAG